jgi:hypothetical protein
MSTAPGRSKPGLHVIRRHESSRLQDQSITCAYEALIPISSRRPAGAHGRPDLLKEASTRTEGTRLSATGA